MEVMSIMIKHLLRVLGLLVISCMGISAIAFADVPDPHGGQGRRPLPHPVYQYWIKKEFHNTSYSEDKLEIVLDYCAPKGTEIRYQLKDMAGNVIQQGADNNDALNGQISLVFNKPAVGQTYNIRFESSCYMSKVKTSFGIKKTDNPTLYGTWNCNYKISRDNNGDCEIDSYNVSDN